MYKEDISQKEYRKFFQDGMTVRVTQNSSEFV